MSEPKKGLALVIGMSKAKKPPMADGEGDAAEEEGEEDDGSYDAAADELFDALKNGDREGFASALKAAVMSCR